MLQYYSCCCVMGHVNKTDYQHFVVLFSINSWVLDVNYLFVIFQQLHSVKLLSVLNMMPQREGPDEFFSFPGKKGSVRK